MKWFAREQVQVAWQAVSKNVLDLDRIRRLFTYNIGLKILSRILSWTSSVTTGAGEYAPMPPVLGP